ncbi:MAG: hypothetical protein JW795_09445 [Chitinivibrionales bacterium]|nr:hypothetical protein [Chitinivibrionales bacterium]
MRLNISILSIVFFFTCCIGHDTLGLKTSNSDQFALTQNIGFYAGFVTGYGISYRRWLSPKHAFQITGLPFYMENRYDKKNVELTIEFTPDSGFSNHGTFSLGSNYLRCISQFSDLALLAYGGSNLFIEYTRENYRERKKNWSNDTIEARYIQNHLIEKKITIGGGLGGEMRMWQLIFNVMIGLQAFYEVESERKGVFPSIEAGGYIAF